jgi:formamidopyrimidine-DNA glycosylase
MAPGGIWPAETRKDMPELPEVETVRRGLEPWVAGAAIEKVTLNRPDLRFPFPKDFVETLEGATITAVGRRYKDPSRYYEPTVDEKHDHAVFRLRHPKEGTLTLIYADSRRFGFMDLFRNEADSPYLAGLGPEPLSNAFNAAEMAARFRGKKAPMKAALLDQRVVAGLGNIYASEALHRAHILPTREARTLVLKSGDPSERLVRLASGVRAVLEEAIEAGGSTLRDFRDADSGAGYFQHHFAVYDREGEPCPTPGCRGTIKRIVQSGRATYFCPVCQH